MQLSVYPSTNLTGYEHTLNTSNVNWLTSNALFGEYNPSSFFNLPVKSSDHEQYIFPIRLTSSMIRNSKFDNFYFKIPNNVMLDVKNNKCKIIFDYSIEFFNVSHNPIDYTHQSILNTMSRYGLTKNDVILITGDYNPQQPSEYSIVTFSIIWSWINTPDRLWVESQLSNINDLKHRPKKILTFMRKPRPHRVAMAQFIYNNNFLDTNITTFPNLKEAQKESKMPKSSLAAEVVEQLKKENNKLLDSLPWVYDIENLWSTEAYIQMKAVGMLPKEAFEQTYISCVSESSVDYTVGVPELDLSEKSILPATRLHPFIIHGQQGTLAKLKEFGLKTFDRWWDESYDSLTDSRHRFAHITKLYKKINAMSNQQLAQMLLEMRPILEHNYYCIKDILDNRKYCIDFNNKVASLFYLK